MATKKSTKRTIKMTKKPTRGDEVSVVFFGLITLFFLISSLLRFTVIGQFCDDFIFSFAFGWDKYFVYGACFFLIVPLLFNYRFKLGYKNITKALAILVVACWTTQTISLMVSEKQVWTNYYRLNLLKMNEQYFHTWWASNIINNYHGFFSGWLFSNINSANFFPAYATGGIISNVLVGIFSYGFFATNFIVNMIAIIILICALFFDQPLLCFSNIKKMVALWAKWCTNQQLKWKAHRKNRLYAKQKQLLAQKALAKVNKQETSVLNNVDIKDNSKEKAVNNKIDSDNDNVMLTDETSSQQVPAAVLPLYDNEDSVLTPFAKLTPEQQKSKVNKSKGTLVLKKSLEESLLNNSSNDGSANKPAPKGNKVNTTNNVPLITTIDKYMPAPIIINDKYRLPQLQSQTVDNSRYNSENEAQALSNQQRLQALFAEFNIKGEIKAFHIGSAITKYEISLTPGVKVNKITSLEDNIKLALGNNNIRIEAPIAGKSMVGIEVPNKHVVTVSLDEVMANLKSNDEKQKLLFALGKDGLGNYRCQSLAAMPHLLIAGTTGSGKSVFINTLLMSLLLRYQPHEIKLVLIDPKWVELVTYNDIPYLLAPVINEARAAVAALKVVLLEMERRYQLLASKGSRNIESYNNKTTIVSEKLPYYVIIIDELADLMVKNSKEMEEGIMRITQMGRAAGIHLVVATQRPSTDIITGVIKNNISARIAFRVSSWIDSRTVIDSSGAEKLIGKGDMLFTGAGNFSPLRVQAPWISEEEVSAVIAFIKDQVPAQYDSNFISAMEKLK